MTQRGRRDFAWIGALGGPTASCGSRAPKASRVAGSLLLVVLGYLLGAFPTGALVARLYGVDLRQQGSRSTGATNALRVLGKPAGAAVLGVDVLKGWLAVYLARRWGGSGWAVRLAGAAAVVGHSYSVFLGGRGGKSVATGLGSLLALRPSACAAAAGVALPIIGATRYVSLGSLAGASVGALVLSASAARGRAGRADLLYAATVSGLIWWRHRENIERLLAGTERRLGERQASLSADEPAAVVRG